MHVFCHKKQDFIITITIFVDKVPTKYMQPSPILSPKHYSVLCEDYFTALLSIAKSNQGPIK